MISNVIYFFFTFDFSLAFIYSEKFSKEKNLFKKRKKFSFKKKSYFPLPIILIQKINTPFNNSQTIILFFFKYQFLNAWAL